MFVTYKLWA